MAAGEEWQIGAGTGGDDAVCEVRVDGDPDRPSVAVMEAVRRATGDPPEPGTLYRAIDPEALDALFAERADGSRREGGMVSFPVEECTVTVYADGTVTAAVLD
ncbi:MAG: HalOD1 output domain-containing protein [Haloferacaceae archaeon]